MKRSLVIFSFLSLFFGPLTYSKDSPTYHLTQDYHELSACDKQAALWEFVEKTQHKSLPKLSKFGLLEVLAMTLQSLSTKKERYSDVAPKGWKKYLHRRAAMASVKFVPAEESQYTGIFSGAPCSLLRLSFTFRPKGDRDVAPGLAWKVFRDNHHSANVSALYALDGQNKNYNFFANPLSNIVPIENALGNKVIHSLFKRVTDYPEELGLSDMARVNTLGKLEKKINSPRQIFFVPNEEISFSEDEHDFREDLQTIEKGSLIYKVYAVTNDKRNYNYENYEKTDISKFVESSKYIGDIITTSKFVASEFGDTKIFFRHQVR